MSFANTHTPLKPKGQAKWQVPQRKGKRNMEFYLEGEILDRFCKLFPKHSNVRIMEWFGISFSTLQRFKREYGLQKNMKAIRKEQAKDAKATCEKNGFYDSLRGKAPSKACLEATRKLRADGFVPMLRLKEKNPRKYRKLMERKRVQRLELQKQENFRVGIGLRQETKLHIPATPFTRQQINLRYSMLKQGYILGDFRERMGERYIIYYNNETTRSDVYEQNARNCGFSIRLLT